MNHFVKKTNPLQNCICGFHINQKQNRLNCHDEKLYYTFTGYMYLFSYIASSCNTDLLKNIFYFQAEPCILSEVNFKRSRYGEEKDTLLEAIPRLQKSDRSHKRQVNIDFTELKAIQPNAVVFSSLEVKKAPELPHTIINGISDLRDTINPENFVELMASFRSTEAAANLEKATVKQSKCTLWHNHRIGRITSSKMHRLFTLRPSTDRTCAVKEIIERHHVKTPAMTYGLQKESIARVAYTKYSRMFHDGFVCTESGLILDPELPYLGASPDGLVECDCCGKGCLEIKCLKTYENGLPDPGTVSDIPSNFPIDDEYQLKKTHPYYTQVQGHMLVCKVGYCDLYLWSKSNSTAVRVFRDDNFIQELLNKLHNEYKTHVLPAILDIVNSQA